MCFEKMESFQGTGGLSGLLHQTAKTDHQHAKLLLIQKFIKKRRKFKNTTTALDDIVPLEVGLVKETYYVFDGTSSLVDKEIHDGITYFDFTGSKRHTSQIGAAAVERNRKTHPTSIINCLGTSKRYF